MTTMPTTFYPSGLPSILHKAPSCQLPLLPILTLLILLLLGCWTQPALADCECGYLSTVNGSNRRNSNHALFTDLLETDFTRFPPTPADNTDATAHNGLAQHKDWARQSFNLSAERARGDYGEMFDVGNVRIVGYDEHSSGYGDGDSGGDGGGDGDGEGKGKKKRGMLELVVRSEVVDGMVPVAELDTQRLDLLWGSFRAMMKVSWVRGTCAAFFWYFNDTQEIDMEFLSKDFNASNSSYPVSLVLQSREAVLDGYDAAQTGNYANVYLPFDPTEDFHEYRIDYLPGRVFFYADGVVLAEMGGPAVPSSPGHLILQHWSNGNKYWSGGPPAEDVALQVRYVKAYFNSSMEQQQQDWESRCRDPTAPNAVCTIPDVTPGNSSAADWFFTDQGSMTNNQTSAEENEGSQAMKPWWMTMGWLLLVGGWAITL